MSARKYGDTSKQKFPIWDNVKENYCPKAVNQKSVSDGAKREKLIVIKKLEGLEKELKVYKDKDI